MSRKRAYATLDGMDASDHGKVIDGRRVSWLGGSAPADTRPTPAEKELEKVATANAVAASLEAAAREGVPFCEECARRAAR